MDLASARCRHPKARNHFGQHVWTSYGARVARKKLGYDDKPRPGDQLKCIHCRQKVRLSQKGQWV